MRVLKKNLSYRVFEHPSKACSNIMQQQSSKPWTPPPKKVRNLFWETPFFEQKQLCKTLILHHPLKTVHWKKTPKTPTFVGSKKGGQVIDLEVAKLLTLEWPAKNVAKLLTLQHICCRVNNMLYIFI